MGLFKKIGSLGTAGGTGFTPRANIPRSDVQGAVEYVMDNAENVGTVYAPTDAEYLTNGAVAGLSNERAVTDTGTIAWDFSTTGQAKANLSHLGLEDLADPGADRGIFWDDSEGATKFFSAGTGMGFVGTQFSITDADLVAIVDTTFSAGDILYHNGTTLARLAAGTDGQFLRTRGSSGTAPDWQNISGGGDMLRANNLSDLTDASAARTNLGLAIGTNVQAYDADLATWAGLTPSANAQSLVTAANYAAMRALLDLEAGTDFYSIAAADAAIAAYAQPKDADLDTWAGLTPSANFQTLVPQTFAQMRTSLSLVPGTDVQAYDAELAAIAGLVSAADKAPYFTGSGTAALADFTAYGRSVVAVANEAAFKALVNLEIGTDVQAYSAVLANTTASFTTADETKLDYITVTQAVDLDAIETRVNALDAAVVLSGTWDASAGTFPGGGTAQAGQSYIVSVAGTVDSVAFVANDRIVAIADNASTTTYAANWHKLDYTDQVLSVAGKTGAVTIQVADVTDMSANGRSLVSAADYAAMRALLDLEAGTDFLSPAAIAAAYLALTGGTLTGSLGVRTSGSTGYATLNSGTATQTGYMEARKADGTRLGYLGWSNTDFAVTTENGANFTVNGSQIQPLDELLTEISALSTDPNADSGLFFDDSAGAMAYWTPTNGLEFSGTNLQMTSTARTRSITFIIDGGGSAITTGVKGDLEIPFACTITGWTLTADQSGSIVIDVWKDTYANAPPTVADTIAGSEKPTLSSTTKNQDLTLSTWTTAVSAGDILRFNVDSITTVTRVTLAIRVTVP